jgi:hypothetical protein
MEIIGTENFVTSYILSASNEYMRSFISFCCFLIVVMACHKQNDNPPTRSFRMGFANSAPRPDFNAFIQSLNEWSQRADAAIISTEIPWDSLLNGESGYDYIIHNYINLVQFYRQKNFTLWVYIDPENGLDRKSDADALVKLGKSIADSDMQNIYTGFVVLMDSLLMPDHLGLALETNLIRGSADPAIYGGVKSAANIAATAIRTFDTKVKLSVSVQVDYAWGKISGQPYIGIDQDLLDFPFLQELGLSSYPYFNFGSTDEIPDNYYSRLVEGKNLPVMVTESGWISTQITGFNGGLITGTPASQQKYIDRQAVLLNQAKAISWFQLTFTDIDFSALPPSTPQNLQYFTTIGLVDTSFQPKPALSSWDSIFRHQYFH